MPPAEPQTDAEPSAPGAAARPRRVGWAVGLAVAAFLVALINTVRWAPVAAAHVGAVGLWSYTVASSALWLWVIVQCGRGRNWARWVFCVPSLLALPALAVVRHSSTTDPTSLAVSAAQAVLNLAAAVLLLSAPAARWFRAPRQHRPPSPR
jgi:hypothetical protein